MDEISKKANGNVISLMAVGDIMFGGKVSRRIGEEGPEWIFSEVKQILSHADLVIGNLESPIVEDQEQPSHLAKVPLGAPEETLKSLSIANFSLMNLANNHIMDYGERGLINTLKNLEDRQIRYVGAGMNENEARRPLKVNLKGSKVAFLSYCASNNATASKSGTAPLNKPSIQRDVEAQKKDSDLIIVSLHHGVEYADYPTPGFTKLARRVIDSGADVVLGHHPHVLQGIEKYKQGIIAYSLGNFVFDLADEKIRKIAYEECLLVRKYGIRFGTNDNRVSQSMILEIRLNNGSLIDYKVHPIFIKSDFRPVPLNGIESDKLLQRIEDLSKDIGDNSLVINQVLRKLEADSLQSYLSDKTLFHYICNLRKLRPGHIGMVLNLVRAKMSGFNSTWRTKE